MIDYDNVRRDYEKPWIEEKKKGGGLFASLEDDVEGGEAWEAERTSGKSGNK